MVGHTGQFEAAVKAIEALDGCIGKLHEKCANENISMILTADHGNADVMKYPDGSPHTSHSDAEVPFCLVHPKLKDTHLMLGNENEEFALKDVAPTILKILNITRPKTFSGSSIFN
jgi:2,3-bisphosphoglycerate-independent phosphoglycerate mutase